MKKLLDSTRKERNDTLRVTLNQQFSESLIEMLRLQTFTPDSLRNLRIGQTTSSDQKLIAYNWNIQQNDGHNLYNCIFYLPLTRKIIVMPVKRSELKIDPDSVYTSGDWPPALYYKIINPKEKTDKYYLMLGWDRFSQQTSRKTIEAITIINDSAVIFGKEVFKTKEGRTKRVVIEYAATANLTLQYSKQKLTLTGVRKSQSRINDSIIVVDRLAPLNEGLEGIRWAYVPVGTTYDGYVYFKKYWTFVEGINARNPAIKGEDKKRNRRPELDLIPKE